MVQRADIGEMALVAIRREPRVGPHFKPGILKIDEEGTATIEAEVANVALKRLVRSQGTCGRRTRSGGPSLSRL